MISFASGKLEKQTVEPQIFLSFLCFNCKTWSLEIAQVASQPVNICLKVWAAVRTWEQLAEML